MRSLAWAQPQFWAIGIWLCAWGALLLQPYAAAAGAYCGLLPVHRAVTPGVEELQGWTTMVAAMMLPLILPQLRSIALSSAWRRRHRAIGWFLCAYLCVWIAVMACCDLLVVTFRPLIPAAAAPAGAATAAGTFVLACLWHLTPIKRRAAARCHRRTPLPMSGWRADFCCLRHGARHGLDCVINCWPVMLAVPLLGGGVGLMALVTGFVVADRYLERAHARLLPLAYAAVALGCMLGLLPGFARS